MLKLLTSEIDNLVKHRDACSLSKDFSPYRSTEKMPYQVDRDEQIILQEMPLDKTIMMTLAIIEQLQDCLQTMGNSFFVKVHSIEITTVIKTDKTDLSEFARLSGLESHEYSIIESIMVSLQRYFDVVVRDPWVLPLEKSKQA